MPRLKHKLSTQPILYHAPVYFVTEIWSVKALSPEDTQDVDDATKMRMIIAMSKVHK